MTKKLLVSQASNKNDTEKEEFLIPIWKENGIRFIGLDTGKAFSLGKVVYIGRNVSENDIFKRLVDNGHKFDDVTQTISIIESYLEQLADFKIGALVRTLPNKAKLLKLSK